VFSEKQIRKFRDDALENIKKECVNAKLFDISVSADIDFDRMEMYGMTFTIKIEWIKPRKLEVKT